MRRPEDYETLVRNMGVKWFVAPVAWTRTASSSPIPAFLGRDTQTEYTSGPFELRRLHPGGSEQARENAIGVRYEPCAAGILDDRASALMYSGQWRTVRDFGGACRGTLTYTDVPGAEVSVRLHGTRVAYLFTKAYTRGRAAIVIDGVQRGIVDQYSPGIEWQSYAEFAGLAPGPHTVTIRVLHDKSADSEGFDVDVDGFLAR